MSRDSKRREKLIRQMADKGRDHRAQDGGGLSAALGRGLSSVLGPAAKKGGLPNLSDVVHRDPSQEWQGKAPRLTPAQQKRLAELTLKAGKRHATELTPENFLELHRRLERELSESVREDKTLKGLLMALEWRCWFSEEGRHLYNTQERFFDVPAAEVADFAADPVIYAVEVFQPRGVPMQHERKEDYLESAEEAIDQAVKRAKAGDGYYSTADRQMGDVPTGLSDTPV